VGANIIGWSKKINVKVNVKLKKATKLFRNGSLKTVFNNGSFKELLLNGSAAFLDYVSPF
jgi:hypothetical protein